MASSILLAPALASVLLHAPCRLGGAGLAGLRARAGLRACAQPPLFDEELNLIYDGKCAICQWERDNLSALGGAGKITFTDLEDPAGYDAEAARNGGVSYQSAMERITAVTRDGEVLTGMEVFAKCYEQVGLGWLFTPLGWPVVGPAVEWAYMRFAAVRTDITRGKSLRELVEEHAAGSARSRRR